MADGVLDVGPGWVVGGVIVTAGVRYVVLGPVPEGRVLDRLDVFYSFVDATIITFGAGFTGSGEASVENFVRSSNLIQRGDTTMSGKPSLALQHPAGGQFRFGIPIGIRVQAGAKYLVCACGTTSADIVTLWNVALFPRLVWRRGKREGLAEEAF